MTLCSFGANTHCSPEQVFFSPNLSFTLCLTGCSHLHRRWISWRKAACWTWICCKMVCSVLTSPEKGFVIYNNAAHIFSVDAPDTNVFLQFFTRGQKPQEPAQVNLLKTCSGFIFSSSVSSRLLTIDQFISWFLEQLNRLIIDSKSIIWSCCGNFLSLLVSIDQENGAPVPL